MCLCVAAVQVSTSRLDIVNLWSTHRPKSYHNHIQLRSFPMGTTPSINLVAHTVVLETVSCSYLLSEHSITKAWRRSLLGILLKLPFFWVVPPAMVLKCVILTWNTTVFQVTLWLLLAICFLFCPLILKFIFTLMYESVCMHVCILRMCQEPMKMRRFPGTGVMSRWLTLQCGC